MADRTETATRTLAEALADYESLFLAARNFAPRTRREYVDDLQDLIGFLDTTSRVTEPQRVERRHLQTYLAELDRRGFANATRRRKVATIRSFFAYLVDGGSVPQNPAERLIPPERDDRPPRVLTKGEYDRLRSACAHETRDAAIVELLLQTGLRLSELAGLTLRDIDLPAAVTLYEGSVGSVHVCGKGRRERTITLNWKACKALRRYLATRPKVEDNRLFISKLGWGMSPRAIEYAVEKYLEEANVPNASVHTLRHTFAAQMVRRGTKLEVVRQVLGHSSLKTTAIYVDLAREEMDRELQANAL